MFARFASAISSGTLITLGLLYAMQALIALQPGAASPDRYRHTLGVFLPQRVDTPINETTLPDREELTRSVDAPRYEGPVLDGVLGQVGVYEPGYDPVLQTPDFTAQPDGPLIAIVRVAPAYPAAAAGRALEGWVDVRFDVLENGSTSNIEVTGSSHPMFEKAAIKAAQRFRYKAPVVDGVPRIARGIEFRFRFEFED